MKTVKAYCIHGMALLGLLAVSGCGEPPKVLQGTVTAYDVSSKVVTVKDELGSQPEVELSLQNAEVGAEPVVGDKVRLAYHDQGGKLAATRLMNLTRQQELGGGAKKSAH
jgi:hypothetical protein